MHACMHACIHSFIHSFIHCSGRHSLMRSDDVMCFICVPVAQCWSVTMYWLLQTDFERWSCSSSATMPPKYYSFLLLLLLLFIHSFIHPVCFISTKH